MYYNVLSDIPAQYREIVQRLIDDGIISSSENLEHTLSDEMLFILKILARKGVL